eukprot:jgi/Chrzof1/11180/Cz05g27040.t1
MDCCTSLKSTLPPSAQSDDDLCYICLEGPQPCEPLEAPCRCPRKVHRSCLARWQLQSAGKVEETKCRFCDCQLPPWQSAFWPADTAASVPVMSIHFNGHTYWLQVQPGVEGLQQFKTDVCKLLGLTDDQPFDITFECRVPGQDTRMELRGLHTFDAAVYCASITASERAFSSDDSSPSSSPRLHRSTHRSIRMHAPPDHSSSNDHDATADVRTTRLQFLDQTTENQHRSTRRHSKTVTAKLVNSLKSFASRIRQYRQSAP